MQKFSDFLEQEQLKPNTIVCRGNASGNQWEVKSCGKNAMGFLRPGTNLTNDQIEDLKNKKWDVRYADEITPKSDGPTSSGKAGVPQKD
jgi:hypothetical protein